MASVEELRKELEDRDISVPGSAVLDRGTQHIKFSAFYKPCTQPLPAAGHAR